MNENAARFCAAAAALSQSDGDALGVLAAAPGGEKSERLISRVLSYGHTSVAEHIVFNVAFHNISAVAEQFLIGFRLASFTVKSRRYADFSEACFFVPTGLSGRARELFENHARELFGEYARLRAAGIPGEDARFALPYCFRSNMLVTVNARELIHIVARARGNFLPEINALGERLAGQLEKLCPPIFAALPKASPETAPERAFGFYPPAENTADIVAAPADADALISAAEAVSGAVFDPLRPGREAEQLCYTIRFNALSLSALTHLARHRMQSLVIPRIYGGSFGARVLPRTIATDPEALERYSAVFARSEEAAGRLASDGYGADTLVYLALSGMTVPALTTMNFRELELFLRLRTCRRAQWEIRFAAKDLLSKLRRLDPERFGMIGPGCFETGKCPEGRMSCGLGAEDI
jgi:thymidylate synthase (FAD)